MYIAFKLLFGSAYSDRKQINGKQNIILNMYNNVSWESFPNELLTYMVGNLADNSLFADVTLVCDDQIGFEAHKIILSSCSDIFRSILMTCSDPNPTIFLPGVNQRELQSLLQYMYTGEVEFDPMEKHDIMEVWSHLQVKSNAVAESVPMKTSEIKTELVNEEMSAVTDSNEEYAGINQNKTEAPENAPATKDKSIKKKGGVSVLCTKCDYQTQNKADHETHFLEAHLGAKKWNKETVCFMCNKIFPKSWNLKQHVTKAHQHPIYNCDYCDFYSFQEDGMQDHMKDHDFGQSEVSCTDCDFKTDDKLKLNKHLLNDHGRLFACNFCPLKNKLSANIIQHVERKHMKEKSCANCQIYKTTSQKRMKQHLLKNCKGNGKEKSCNNCLVYKTKSNKRMQRHQLNSCKGTRKKFICDTCSKFSTNSKSIMNRHQSRFCLNRENLNPIKQEYHPLQVQQ